MSKKTNKYSDSSLGFGKLADLKSFSKNFNDPSKNNTDRVLVYSDDPKDKGLLDGSLQKALESQKNKEVIEKNQFVAVFRIETGGRGGKTVTVLDKLPKDENFLKDLTKEFKTKCGTGGAYKINADFGLIEVQGDKRDAMKKILDAKKIKFKGM